MNPTGEIHPVAALFPLMADEELADLAADIAANGLLYPIVLDADGTLIDGRNRLRACQIAGVAPSFTTLDGRDPVAYILSANIGRRNLTKSQRAMTIAEINFLVPKKWGAKGELAAMYGISQALLSQALQVRQFAPELAEQVMAGTLGLDAAYAIARERKAAREGEAAQAARLAERHEELRRRAPELADLVIEGTLTLDGAFAELEARQKREDTERWAVSKTVAELVQTLEALTSTPAAREHTARYFDAGRARERGVTVSAATWTAASQWLAALGEEWSA